MLFTPFKLTSDAILFRLSLIPHLSNGIELKLMNLRFPLLSFILRTIPGNERALTCENLAGLIHRSLALSPP